MVHYFGQPQDIKKFQTLCNKHKILLIEDNAHGFGGNYNGNELGTYGDIGISSPRKTINIASGGVLWQKGNYLNDDITIPSFSPSIFNYLNIIVSNYYPSIKSILKKILQNRPKYEDYKLFREGIINDYTIDSRSKKVLQKINIENMIKHRQKGYHQWYNFALENNLTPVFSKLHEEASPWCFPAFVKNHDESTKWFDWGWEHNVHVFSWPSLPEAALQKNKELMDRWEKLVCFEIK